MIASRGRVAATDCESPSTPYDVPPASEYTVTCKLLINDNHNSEICIAPFTIVDSGAEQSKYQPVLKLR